MKKKLTYLIFIFTLLLAEYGCANEPIAQNEKLFLTAKIWGFLKYYHPEVASGKFNWDKTLFKWINETKEIDSSQDLSQFFVRSIHELGEIKHCKKCHRPKKGDYFLKNFDLTWIKDYPYTDSELKKILHYIESNRHLGKQYYVAADYAGHVKFINEPVYASSEWEKSDFRLLLLFKYWNAVEYFYPYKYLTSQDWDEVLKEMIPRFLEVSSEMEFHLLLRELTIKLDDSHSFFRTDYMDRFFGKKRFPFQYLFVGDKVVITKILNDSLANIDDYKVGDVILKIDGEPMIDRYAKTRKYYNGSNEITKKKYSFIGLLRGDSARATMLYERNGIVSTKEVNRYKKSQIEIKKTEDMLWKKISADIAYIDVTALEKKDIKPILKSAMDMETIIFDVRGYPDFLLYDIAKYLMPVSREFFRAIKPDYSYPGKFYWKKPLTCGKKNSKAYKGKVIILVDENTQSLGEFTAMCLQVADNPITVGHTTAAANGDVATFTFFESGTTWITGLGAYYADKTQTQRVGLKVDVEVYPTIESIRQGRDLILDKAIELAKSE